MIMRFFSSRKTALALGIVITLSGCQAVSKPPSSEVKILNVGKAFDESGLKKQEDQWLEKRKQQLNGELANAEAVYSRMKTGDARKARMADLARAEAQWQVSQAAVNTVRLDMIRKAAARYGVKNAIIVPSDLVITYPEQNDITSALIPLLSKMKPDFSAADNSLKK